MLIYIVNDSPDKHPFFQEHSQHKAFAHQHGQFWSENSSRHRTFCSLSELARHAECQTISGLCNTFNENNYDEGQYSEHTLTTITSLKAWMRELGSTRMWTNQFSVVWTRLGSIAIFQHQYWNLFVITTNPLICHHLNNLSALELNIGMENTFSIKSTHCKRWPPSQLPQELSPLSGRYWRILLVLAGRLVIYFLKYEHIITFCLSQHDNIYSNATDNQNILASLSELS